MEGQIEKFVCKMIDRLTHASSGETFRQHAKDSEIVKCIKCMQQICGTNGDKIFLYKLSKYHNRTSELNNLEQGEKSEAEYKEEMHC